MRAQFSAGRAGGGAGSLVLPAGAVRGPRAPQRSSDTFSIIAAKLRLGAVPGRAASFVRAVGAVLLEVAPPAPGDAAHISAAEIGGLAGGMSVAACLVFQRGTVSLAVTEPLSRHATTRRTTELPASTLTGRAAALVGPVATVGVSVTHPHLRNTRTRAAKELEK